MSASSGSNPLEELKSAGWLLIAAGAISIVAGLFVIAYPDISLKALAILAGINIIVLSVMSLVDAIGSGSDGGARALSAIVGVLGLIAGLVVLRRPAEALLVIVLVVGIWLVVSGAVQFVRSFEDSGYRGLRMVAAIGEIALGILILSLPDISLRTVAILIGIGFVWRGALSVYTGWQLRKAGSASHARLAPAA